ncbi:MAG: tryptophan synthase subunit alpha [Archaeoglobaceae archaeon]|nr:tryptophan synthase subunit alpha [Archaeoglobaceae archaeon]MDW8013678.1 tryptophan synthase subunit alpha [Archaeoglobaceae archaeon]
MLKKDLLVFLTAGDPDTKATLDFMLSVEKYAIIELGIPFSDPIADGKTIQRSYYRALKNGFRVKDVFLIAKEFRQHSEKPLVLMTYYNPVFRLGLEKFVERAKESGFNAILLVDLPIDEAGAYLEVCRKFEIGTVFLAAPNTKEERLKAIDDASTFVYLVSLYGTTGAREELSSLALDLLFRAKKICKKPLAVGFGISKAEHVEKLIKNGANGVVVGSAVIEIIEKFGKDAGKYLEEKVKELSRALN